MDQAAVNRIHRAVEAAREAARTAKLDRCDVGDVDEVIETVERELRHPVPNLTTLTMMLNSLAKTLAASGSAASVSREIDRVLHLSGLPATWNQ
jgi:hypothetical protein